MTIDRLTIDDYRWMIYRSDDYRIFVMKPSSQWLALIIDETLIILCWWKFIHIFFIDFLCNYKLLHFISLFSHLFISFIECNKSILYFIHYFYMTISVESIDWDKMIILDLNMFCNKTGTPFRLNTTYWDYRLLVC